MLRSKSKKSIPVNLSKSNAYTFRRNPARANNTPNLKNTNTKQLSRKNIYKRTGKNISNLVGPISDEEMEIGKTYTIEVFGDVSQARLDDIQYYEEDGERYADYYVFYNVKKDPKFFPKYKHEYGRDTDPDIIHVAPMNISSIIGFKGRMKIGTSLGLRARPAHILNQYLQPSNIKCPKLIKIEIPSTVIIPIGAILYDKRDTQLGIVVGKSKDSTVEIKTSRGVKIINLRRGMKYLPKNTGCSIS